MYVWLQWLCISMTAMVLYSWPLWFYIHDRYGSIFMTAMVLYSWPLWFYIHDRHGSIFMTAMVLYSWPLWFYIHDCYGSIFVTAMALYSWLLWLYSRDCYGSTVVTAMALLSWLLWLYSRDCYGSTVVTAMALQSWLLWLYVYRYGCLRTTAPLPPANLARLFFSERHGDAHCVNFLLTARHELGPGHAVTAAAHRAELRRPYDGSQVSKVIKLLSSPTLRRRKLALVLIFDSFESLVSFGQALLSNETILRKLVRYKRPSLISCEVGDEAYESFITSTPRSPADFWVRWIIYLFFGGGGGVTSRKCPNHKY